MILRLAQEKFGDTLHREGLGIAVGSMSMLLLATHKASNLIYIRPVYFTSSSGDQLHGVLAAAPTNDNAVFASSLPRAIADLLGPTPPAQVSPRGGGAVPARVKQLLRLAERDFVAAQKALKEQELGLYESKNQAGIALVDQANDLLADSAPAKSKHTTRKTGAAKPAAPATIPSTASTGGHSRTGRQARTTGVTGEGTGSA